MASQLDLAALVGRVADEQLLDENPSRLPPGVGRPEEIRPTRIRGRLVGAGAALTGVTLLTGIALIAFGAIRWISSGIGAGDIAALVVGAILVATHWGWVHVAEATADAIDSRGNEAVVARRRNWLQTIEPYTRYEVTTVVRDDGSIAIDRVEHRPVPRGDRAFVFTRRTERVAVYSGDDAAAAVAERAELMRQQAAADTERQRQQFTEAADAYQRAVLEETDEQQELAIRRAASEALSKQINAHLHDPPVD